MLSYILITIIALIAYTYYRWDTVSPKLVVREASTLAGMAIGATPEVIKTTTTMVKAANAKTELELKTAGSLGPVGLREGSIIAKKATRDTLKDITKASQTLLDESLAELAKLETK